MTLGALLREPLRNGHSARRSPSDHGVRTLTLSAVTYGDFSESNTKLTIANPAKVNDLWLEPGDLLIERSNTPELVGTARLYRGPRHFAIFPDLLIRARFRPDVLPEFAELQLRSDRARDFFTGNAQGTAGSMPKIDQGLIARFPFVLPPLSEQKRIADRIAALLAQVIAARERLTRVREILKRFRQSALAAASSGKLTERWRAARPTLTASSRRAVLAAARQKRWEELVARRRSARPPKYRPAPPPAPDNAEMPDSWVWASVAEMTLLDVGFAFRSAEFADAGLRLLRGENVEPSALRWTDTKYWAQEKLGGYEHLLVEEGDLILAMDRPLVSKGLKLAQATRQDVPSLLVQRVMRLRAVERDAAPYLRLCLLGDRFRRCLTGTAMTGSDLPHITGTAVAEFAVPLPPQEEQDEIVRRVEALFSVAAAIEERLATAVVRTERLPQAISAKAFLGELLATAAEVAHAT